MSASQAPLGSPVGAVLSFLRTNVDVIAADPSFTFSTDLVGWDEGASGGIWCTAVRHGGRATGENSLLWLREVDIQLDWLGALGTNERLEAFAEQCMTSLGQIHQVGYKGVGIGISGTEVLMDLAWLPDPLTEKPRWTASVTVTCAPIPLS
jgi:hypothetical protein